MRWLINYFRQCFCAHELEREEAGYEVRSYCVRKRDIAVSATCTKCGWHRSYWKYDV